LEDKHSDGWVAFQMKIWNMHQWINRALFLKAQLSKNFNMTKNGELVSDYGIPLG
jgi:hypothetical protein